LLTTGVVLGLRVLAGKGGIAMAPLHEWRVWLDLLLLTTVSGSLPLFVYFAGLRTTPAALAGYCEMFYTVTASVIAWAFLGGKLAPHQIVAGVILVGAIVMLNRVGAVEGDARS
jgi:drug/metabolite transporter (DMT)-like permease